MKWNFMPVKDSQKSQNQKKQQKCEAKERKRKIP